MHLTFVQASLRTFMVTQSKLFIARDCASISKNAFRTSWFCVADEGVNYFSDMGENLNLTGFRPWNELQLYRMRWHTRVPQQVVNNVKEHDITSII